MPLFGPAMPLPNLDDPDTREFWELCRQHRLAIQQCALCNRFRFAPAPMCFNCHSLEYRWVESEGIGEIFTWTVVHRPVHVAVKDMVPYNTIVVRLMDCEGALITSNLLGVDPDSIEAGLLVEVEWDDVSATCSLPRFRRLSAARSRELAGSTVPFAHRHDRSVGA